ncbi:hypothetical protein QA639_21735 [Bradyrhizobium pachyrhizi]|uniref:hypothetical protein n=1 Tax=Bradyrhizobium pachyrhizi TaxID=280333 RepID=UPI0024B2154C|nr:hypothetical protein [Bradyrhizobium pachyrhizi]WFU52331.1 hypothetical protein QA639_21735 [Bradyrhizobium pachyrhizi]
MALADVTLADVMGLVGPLLAVVGAISGVWYRMETKVEGVRKDAADSIHGVEKELADFKMKVVEEYASWDTVRAIEARLTERMDGLSNQVMAMPDAVVDRITKFLNLKSA